MIDIIIIFNNNKNAINETMRNATLPNQLNKLIITICHKFKAFLFTLYSTVIRFMVYNNISNYWLMLFGVTYSINFDYTTYETETLDIWRIILKLNFGRYKIKIIKLQFKCHTD